MSSSEGKPAGAQTCLRADENIVCDAISEKSKNARSAPQVGFGLRPVSAADYHAALRARFVPEAPIAAPEEPGSKVSFSALVLRDLPRDIELPPLIDDVFSLHLGINKRIVRIQDGHRTTHDVATKSFTLHRHNRPARWCSEGPITFAHIILDPQAFDMLAITELGRSRGDIELTDEVGTTNDVLVGLGAEMMRVAQNRVPESRFYRDSLFTAFGLALLRHCSTARAVPKLLSDEPKLASGGMAGWRLRQITDYIQDHIGADIGLDDLTRVSGLSRAHFFRAFRRSVGCTPGHYLMRLRVGAARKAIESGATLSQAAASAGFPGSAAMGHAFRRILAVNPGAYRRWYKGA